MRRFALTLGALAAGSALLLSSGGPPTQAATAQVSIVDFAFSPASATARVGDTVTWTNTGAAPHTTTSDDAVWGSLTLASGESFSHTFDTPGTYGYFCAIHDGMRATVTVLGPAAYLPLVNR